jgi:serine/threonine-protein kinase
MQPEVIAGRYRVERVLGTGGMGVVVAATHLELLEPVAIKLMHPTAIYVAGAVQRFLREARAAARLKSQHVAHVFDAGRLENGAPFMVMEYLEGSDMRAVLKKRHTLPVQEAVLYVLQACEALAEAHAHGIVHRDLKPANLFLTQGPDGSPCIKLLDFGISKVLGPDALETMTRSNVMLGTPSYMSPEQMQSARSVDFRSDVWSLGVILYRMITGFVPFPADDITELVSAVMQRAPSPPSRKRPSLPGEVDTAILRCLAREREARYQTVAELAAALAPFAPRKAEGALERIERLLASAPSSRRAQPSLELPARAEYTVDREAETRAEEKKMQTRADEAAPSEPPSVVAEAGPSWARTLRSNRTPERAPRSVLAFAVLGVAALVLAWAMHRSGVSMSPAAASATLHAMPLSAWLAALPPVEAPRPLLVLPEPSTSVATAEPKPSPPREHEAKAAPRPADPFGRSRK